MDNEVGLTFTFSEFLQGMGPRAARLPQMLRPLTADAGRGVFVLSSFLELTKVTVGPLHHAILHEWLEYGLTAEEDLKHFVLDRYGRELQSVRSCWDRAVKVCEGREGCGQWVAVWRGGGPAWAGEAACPRVVFGRGRLDEGKPWAALFNSRKPRITTGEEEWLEALRRILPVMESAGYGFASSRGTTTYDLVTGYATRAGCRTLLVEPALPDGNDGWNPVDEAPRGDFPILTLSCMGSRCRCPERVANVCRDRLLAFVADLHCILEIRRGGNLHCVIQGRQVKEPGPLLFFRPGVRGPANEGTERLFQDFHERAAVFRLEDFPERAADSKKPWPHRGLVSEVTHVEWGEYLYHYTRGCPGPWPGQSPREYIEDLLDGSALCAHRALDTLVRIVAEGRLRAGSRLVKGEADVVSWTSRPPVELGVLRWWNRGLIRWTFEPYGVAVRKKVLREQGAQPVIYARSSARLRLKPEDRYRFQKHEPPGCTWKHEREWRVPADVPLKDLAPSDWFLFVPDGEALNGLSHCCRGRFRVLALSEAANRTPGE